MIRGSEIIGSAILNTNQDSTDYYVKELIYCSKKLKALGLLVHKHVKSKEKLVIQYKKVKEFSKNGVIITSHKDLLLPQQVPEIEIALNQVSSLIEFEIYGINRELVGIVKDTIIDLKTGKIVGLIMSEGVLTDIVNGYKIIPLSNEIDFNKRNIIIDSNSLPESICLQQGGLKKMLGIEHEN